MTFVPNSDHALRIYDAEANWLATLAYGTTHPTTEAVYAKIAEYNGHDATMEIMVNGVQVRREYFRAWKPVPMPEPSITETCPKGHADPIYVDDAHAECAVCGIVYSVA